MTRSTVSNGFVASLFVRIGARIIASIFQFVTFMILARELGPQEFGKFALLISLSAVASGLMAWGLPTASLRILASPTPRATALSTLLILLPTFSGIAALTGSLGIALGFPLPLVAAASLSVFVEGSNDAAQWVLTGLERHTRAALFMITRRAATASAVVVATVAGEPILSLFSIATALILTLPLYTVMTLRGSWTPLHAVIRDARRFWPLSLLTAVWSLDVAVASLSLGTRSAGLYAASAKLAGPLGLAVRSLLAITTPRLVASTPLERAQINRVIRRVVWAFAVIVTIASPFVALAAIWLLGSQYSDAFPILVAVCVASGVSAFAQHRIAVLIADDRATVANVATGIGVAVGLIAIASLGGNWGAEGLAVAVVLTQLTILGLLMVLERTGEYACRAG